MPGFELNAAMVILLITVGISLWAFSDRRVMGVLINSPYLVVHQRQWYRILTQALIHSDPIHLGVNMFVFYWSSKQVLGFFNLYFGGFGTVLFLILYIGGVAFAALPSLRKHRNNYQYQSLGASGAVASVLFAFILFQPAEILYLYAIVPIPAWLLGILYLAYEYWMDKRKAQDRIAHDAHYWGALYGVVFTLLLKPSLAINFFNAIFG